MFTLVPHLVLLVYDLSVRLFRSGEAEVPELDVLLSVQEHIGRRQVPANSQDRVTREADGGRKIGKTVGGRGCTHHRA